MEVHKTKRAYFAIKTSKKVPGKVTLKIRNHFDGQEEADTWASEILSAIRRRRFTETGEEYQVPEDAS